MIKLIAQNSTWLLILSLSISLFLLALNLIFFFQLRSLKRKNKFLFSEGEAKSLEAIVADQAESLKDIDKEIQELFEVSNRINNLAMHSLHKVGIVRYNPFKDLGGDQSFVITLLDGKNSGLTISSLHTREGTRVYAKPILKGESRYPLTQEEKQAIKIASPIKESKI